MVKSALKKTFDPLLCQWCGKVIHEGGSYYVIYTEGGGDKRPENPMNMHQECVERGFDKRAATGHQDDWQDYLMNFQIGSNNLVVQEDEEKRKQRIKSGYDYLESLGFRPKGV